MTSRRLIALVCAVAFFGLYGIGDALEWWIAGVVGAVTLLLCCLPSKAIDLLGAFLLALLTLIGVNVIAHLLGAPKLPILVGLVIALAVVIATIAWLLNLKGWRPGVGLGVGVGIAVAAIIVAPIVVAALNAKKTTVPTSAPVASKLDLLIVTDGSHHPAPRQIPPDPELEEFEVHYSVGYADGEAVRWTLVDGESATQALAAAARGADRPTVSGAPVEQEGADTALTLFIDGTDPVTEDAASLPDLPQQPGEVARWQQVAADAAPADTPTFALLQTRSPSRLRAWKGFESSGEAISVQTLGSATETDAAFRLAVGAPTARTDLALATTYRPILLFDRDEPVPRVLSVLALFAEGRLQLCDDTAILGTECGSEPILHPRELRNGGTHLRISTRPPEQLQTLAREELAGDAGVAAPAGPSSGLGAAPAGTPPPGTPATAVAEDGEVPPGAGSAIYVHPVAVNHGHQHLLYLDYWWYLTDNPVGVGGGALCGFGLVIAGATCQNHQSDWEGMTVVIDRSGAEPQPVAVQYAQHDTVIRYPWDQLRSYWENDPRSTELTAGITDAANRPLAYIAQGTHATYPFHCGECNEVAHSELSEGPHRGGIGWIGNESGTCGRASCVQLLPTVDGGRQPALWNAYDGPWGERHCALTYYCDSGAPPAAPGQQGRYKHPAHYDGSGDEQGGFVPGLIEG